MLRLLLLASLLLSGCAAGEGTYRYCIGACGEVTVSKEVSPNKPQDFEVLIKEKQHGIP